MNQMINNKIYFKYARLSVDKSHFPSCFFEFCRSLVMQVTGYPPVKHKAEPDPGNINTCMLTSLVSSVRFKLVNFFQNNLLYFGSVKNKICFLANYLKFWVITVRYYPRFKEPLCGALEHFFPCSAHCLFESLKAYLGIWHACEEICFHSSICPLNSAVSPWIVAGLILHQVFGWVNFLPCYLISKNMMWYYILLQGCVCNIRKYTFRWEHY